MVDKYRNSITMAMIVNLIITKLKTSNQISIHPGRLTKGVQEVVLSPVLVVCVGLLNCPGPVLGLGLSWACLGLQLSWAGLVPVRSWAGPGLSWPIAILGLSWACLGSIMACPRLVVDFS